MVSTDDENVMVFCEEGLELTLKEVGAFALSCGQKPNDVYEVNTEELQYYLYSPVWIECESKYKVAKERAERWLSKASEEDLEKLDRIYGIYKTK